MARQFLRVCWCDAGHGAVVMFIFQVMTNLFLVLKFYTCKLACNLKFKQSTKKSTRPGQDVGLLIEIQMLNSRGSTSNLINLRVNSEMY